MSNDKHYPLHPNATHPPIMTCEIPLEEYESLKRKNAELKDKCQRHDFFWEGCGFAKRGFKNTIAVSEAFDKLEAENAELKAKLYEAEEARIEAGADAADYYQENRRLKRALYIAHEYKAKFKRWWLHLALDCEASMIRQDQKNINRIKRKIEHCQKSERKCRDKAEEYK